MVLQGEVTALLEAGGEVHAVKAAQTLGDYRVDEIREDTIALTYLPSTMRQVLHMRAVGDPAGVAGVASASPLAEQTDESPIQTRAEYRARREREAAQRVR